MSPLTAVRTSETTAGRPVAGAGPASPCPAPAPDTLDVKPPADPTDAVSLSTPVASASSPLSANAVPFEALRGIARYESDFYELPQEASELHGLIYEQYADGRVVPLKKAAETTPDIPAGGPDIPADAVKNNRVFIYVDGIHQDIATQQDQIHRLFQAPRNDPKHGASADQPVIGIHEAAGFNAGADGTRIALDLVWMKALQGRFMPLSWIRKACYVTDAAVKSVHHQVRQSLEAGRDVQIALHSGGGAETALALTLLSKEDGGKWKNMIRDHVRVLAMAPAASIKDFELAGVKTENIYYTASKIDPVYRLAHKYVAPWEELALVARASAVGVELLFNRESIPYHSPDYILWRNVEPNGTQRIQAYLDGGPGGEHILP